MVEAITICPNGRREERASMIVITGANGHFGRAVVDSLLTKAEPSRVAVSVRDPEKAQDLAARSISVRRGDFADPATLQQAFDGAEQLLLISVNLLGDEAVCQHGNAIQAARAAGVKRILYTSHQAASPTSLVPFARDHAATESLLQQAGVPFVSLRNGFYAESALYQLGGVASTHDLALPQDGPVSWTARADLAEAAATALVYSQRLDDGISPPLTAASAITFAQVADLASELLGRNVTRTVIDEAAYRSTQLAHGLPAPVVDMLASLFAATRAPRVRCGRPCAGHPSRPAPGVLSRNPR